MSVKIEHGSGSAVRNATLMYGRRRNEDESDSQPAYTAVYINGSRGLPTTTTTTHTAFVISIYRLTHSRLNRLEHIVIMYYLVV